MTWWTYPLTQGRGPTNETLDSPRRGFANYNTGLDFAVPSGTPIESNVVGTVETSGQAGGFGVAVQIRDSQGNLHNFGHLSSTQVKVGDKVQVGQIIGLSGNTGKSTGPHLSYDVFNSAGEDIAPEPFIPNQPGNQGTSASSIIGNINQFFQNYLRTEQAWLDYQRDHPGLGFSPDGETVFDASGNPDPVGQRLYIASLIANKNLTGQLQLADFISSADPVAKEFRDTEILNREAADKAFQDYERRLQLADELEQEAEAISTERQQARQRFEEGQARRLALTGYAQPGQFVTTPAFSPFTEQQKRLTLADTIRKSAGEVPAPRSREPLTPVPRRSFGTGIRLTPPSSATQDRPFPNIVSGEAPDFTSLAGPEAFGIPSEVALGTRLPDIPSRITSERIPSLGSLFATDTISLPSRLGLPDIPYFTAGEALNPGGSIDRAVIGAGRSLLGSVLGKKSSRSKAQEQEQRNRRIAQRAADLRRSGLSSRKAIDQAKREFGE